MEMLVQIPAIEWKKITGHAGTAQCQGPRATRQMGQDKQLTRIWLTPPIALHNKAFWLQPPLPWASPGDTSEQVFPPDPGEKQDGTGGRKGEARQVA